MYPRFVTTVCPILYVHSHLQAPVHTDALTDYKDDVTIIKASDPPGLEIREKQTSPAAVVEQRISHFLMGLAIIGTMTGPLLIMLHTMPHAVFAGVFFVVGWGSIEGNGITAKLLFLAKEHRYVQPDEPLLRVRKRRILYFVFWQLLGWACTVAISQTIAAIGFPVLITALIPFRWIVMPRIFTVEELTIMDSLTATNAVVLSSMGGNPRMPEEVLREKKGLSDEESASGSGSGNGNGVNEGEMKRHMDEEEKRARLERGEQVHIRQRAGHTGNE